MANGRYTITEASPARREAYSGEPFGYAGYLDQIDGFDNGFFGLSPHEAMRLDPHHRLLLETVWEAIEDAGLPAETLAGSRTGVYTSCFAGHYWQLLRGAGMHDMHAILGAHRSSSPAGRIAHVLDLRGPSIETESHCASSLVATHLACQAIRSGEIGMAIVGGVNLLLTPSERLGLAEAGIQSPTYRCRFGDQGADGYVPAEGAVTVVLKPLDDAVAAGDQIYATIIGSAVSSNGRQAFSPSGTGTTGQQDLLRIALQSAGVSPSDVDYVEAHGPGTPAGDEVELTALRRVLSDAREPGRRCLVGSVKSNIGHAEPAAGVAGLLKTALALRHRTIPATLHVTAPSPVLDGSPVQLARTTAPWPERGRPGIAGVTALGMFGIGAHVVLTEAPAPVAPAPRPEPRALVLSLSTRDPVALSKLASAYADTVAGADRPADVCHTAATRRSHLPHRLAVAGADRHALVDRLRRFAAGDPLAPASSRAGRPPRTVFVFSGQGSQWLGMCREMFTTEPVFADSMRLCDELIRAERGASLLDRLLSDEPLAGEYEIQPVLWAIQVSLAAVWRHWGIEPDLVIGHSMGEIAAATVAGALSPRDGAAVICRRSALVGTLANPGAMVAVELGEAAAREAIGDLADRVSVAVVNSAHATVLAGDPDALATVVEPLRERGVFCRPIAANYASHSPNVEPLRDALLAALTDVRPRAESVPMHSTVHDGLICGKTLDAEYWMANLRQPVRFASAVRAVLDVPGPTVFLELSPHPLLVPAIEDEIASSGADAVAVASLLRHRPERETMLSGLSTVYMRGGEPDWERVHGAGTLVALPSYPWQRKRFWPAAPVAEPEPPAPVYAPAATPEPDVDLDARTLRLVVPSASGLAEQIAQRAAEVLAAAPGSVDLTLPLYVAGMDSVLAARLRLRLKQDLDLSVPVADLLDDRPLIDIARELHDNQARVLS